jgi:hypothetical protein
LRVAEVAAPPPRRLRGASFSRRSGRSLGARSLSPPRLRRLRLRGPSESWFRWPSSSEEGRGSPAERDSLATRWGDSEALPSLRPRPRPPRDRLRVVAGRSEWSAGSASGRGSLERVSAAGAADGAVSCFRISRSSIPKVIHSRLRSLAGSGATPHSGRWTHRTTCAALRVSPPCSVAEASVRTRELDSRHAVQPGIRRQPR